MAKSNKSRQLARQADELKEELDNILNQTRNRISDSEFTTFMRIRSLLEQISNDRDSLQKPGRNAQVADTLQEIAIILFRFFNPFNRDG